jgi:hypothetical protein
MAVVWLMGWIVSRSDPGLLDCVVVPGLPPTSANVDSDDEQPYFLWWAELTCAQFREKLRQGTPEERAYWLGALLREANTRDVWLFTTVAEVRDLWGQLYKHLGRSKTLWSYLLQLAPPPERRSAA